MFGKLFHIFVADPADATISVSGYTGVYDGNPHGATGTAKGIKGEDLSSLLHLGDSFTNVPGGTANWTFDGNTNYKTAKGSATITITQKAASVTPNAASKTYGSADPAFSGTLNGFIASDNVTATYSRTAGETVGTYTISAVLNPAGVHGNYAITYNTATFSIQAWTLKGFYQPVDMSTISTLIYNTVKNGSTVPLKFEIFAGSTELTNTSSVKSLTNAQTSCDANALTDDIETTATGGTVLRYDTTDGQFIYNWKTPNTAGKCYRVTMTTLDGSSLAAYFKLK